MKKTISIILAVLMLLGCVSVASVSAATTTDITVNGKTQSATIGDKVTYTVNATAPSLTENGQFTVFYPMDLLEIADYHFPTVGDFGVTANYQGLTNEFRFNYSNTDGFDFTAGQTLVTVEFNVKAAGTGEIKLDKQVMCNTSSENIVNSVQFDEILTVPEIPVAPAAKLNTTSKKIAAGKTFKLSVKNTTAKVKYASTKTAIAKVASNGTVTALKKGTAYIKATVDGKVLKCKVVVSSSPKLNKTSVKVKKGKTVTVTLTGKASAIKNAYTNTKVAKITSAKTATKIKVKGLKVGSTTLRVKVNGVVTLKLKVKVTKK